MIRFLDWDQFRGNIYFVECHAELMPLFEKLDNVTQVFPFRDDLRYEEQIAHPPVDENEFDFQIPFMSLAHFANAEYSEQLFQGPYLVGNSQLNNGFRSPRFVRKKTICWLSTSQLFNAL